MKEMISCPGIVAEIDESKFTKYKYYRAKHCSNGSWIFRGIKRTDEKRFFDTPIMKHDAKTLLPIMQAFIHLESIIMSNKWGDYNNINKLDQRYEHQIVNYSKNFVNPTIGAYTNRIESK